LPNAERADDQRYITLIQPTFTARLVLNVRYISDVQAVSIRGAQRASHWPALLQRPIS
jgi:hypothetical protein